MTRQPRGYRPAAEQRSLDPRTVVYGAVAVVLLLVLVVLPVSGIFDLPQVDRAEDRTMEGRVIRIVEESMQSTPRGQAVLRTVELEAEGGSIVIETFRVKGDAGMEVSTGDRVVISVAQGPDGEVYFISDHVRKPSLLLLAGAFAVMVIVVGRWQGALSLLGLAISLLVIIRFIVPGILTGFNPIFISVIGAMVIMFCTLYLSHGVDRKTTVAIVGISISLAFAAVLGSLFMAAAHLTGLADEHALTLSLLTGGGINPEGLLLAGIIIGALGVLDDVAIAQSSAVFELRRANPLLGAIDLYQRAMNVGRDHIASTVNTLVLAYAGASLPLLMLLATQAEPLGVLPNREYMATEIVRTLVGSMGIVAAVPVTTLLAALAAGRLSGSDGGAEVAAPTPREPILVRHADPPA
jgi:uncharacterized membrane protein